jgi:hypothetical protein
MGGDGGLLVQKVKKSLIDKKMHCSRGMSLAVIELGVQ